MGVHGLWKLLEPSGQMVPLESLAGKILAVDVSIWLHQAIKGMHDTHGAPVGAAHLIVLFHRLCKLLFYKIKPVFVFDGGVPALKHQTLAARRSHSNAAKTEALKVREKLIKNLLKHEAVRQVLANETASAALGLNSFGLPGPSFEEDLYKLPPIAAEYADSASSEELASESEEENEKHNQNIHSIDVTSQEFLKLPPDVRHDILTEIIETRKQSSWKYLDDMPKNSDNFSDFQMNRLLKRHAVQTSLEKAGKEMGGRALSIQELEAVLDDKGVLYDLPSKRIAQDNVTRYMLIQRSAESEGDQTRTPEESKSFDIMKHLDDVDWSSESETDAIAGKCRKTAKKGDECREEEHKGNVSEIAKVPKMQMTKEVANILSTLEDDDVEQSVKAKLQDIQHRLNITEAIKEEEEEENEGEGETVNIKSENQSFNVEEKIEKTVKSDESDNAEGKRAEEVGRISEEAISGRKEKAFVEVVRPDANAFEDSLVESEETIESKVTQEVDGGTTNDSSTRVPPDRVEVEEELEKSQGFSSSDSESDFIPIATENFPKTPQDTKSVQEKKEFEELSITVRPSDISGPDDLFADVFIQSQKESTERMEVDAEEIDGGDSGVHPENQRDTAEDALDELEMELGRDVVSRGDLKDLKTAMEEKQYDLMKEQGKQERQALNPTEQMCADAQELLKLFGIPYVVAPMEAEAQCAVLNTLGLTQGTITDDSDIWLFGGQVVYKNFFNQAKHVLEYTSANIHKCFKLAREDLIRMAVLVGSDYTVGVRGIGPVTALEILASFPSSTDQSLFDGLERFRDWFTGRCKTTSPRHSLKRKIRNIIISPGFPNRAVAEAYLHPQVDDSKEPFSWDKPNLDLIRKYVKMKMGWSSEKCNNLLLPVIKKLEENKCQNTMEKYLKSVPKTVGVLSKRVENAIRLLEGTEASEETNHQPRSKRKRKTSKGKDAAKCLKSTEESTGGAENSKTNRTGSELSSERDQSSKEMLINEKLHSKEIIPQKERTQRLQEERKKHAIEIYRMVRERGGGSRKKRKEFAKIDANLSESSSEND